jgi:DNA replication protein DnaC
LTDTSLLMILTGSRAAAALDGAAAARSAVRARMAERETRRFMRHRAKSALSPHKRLSSFDFAAVPNVYRAEVTVLTEAHEWLDRGANVRLFGPPGIDKCHLILRPGAVR